MAANASMNPAESAAWRDRLGAVVAAFHDGAETSGAEELSEEEPAAFVCAEIKAHRADRRDAGGG